MIKVARLAAAAQCANAPEGTAPSAQVHAEVRAQRRRNFGRPREQIVEEAAAQVENLLFNKPLSDGQNLFRRFNHICSIPKATASKSPHSIKPNPRHTKLPP